MDETEGERDRLITGFQSLIMEKTEETDYQFTVETEERDWLITGFQSLAMEETEARVTGYQFSKPHHGEDRRKRRTDYHVPKPCHGRDRRRKRLIIGFSKPQHPRKSYQEKKGSKTLTTHKKKGKKLTSKTSWRHSYHPRQVLKAVVRSVSTALV